MNKGLSKWCFLVLALGIVCFFLLMPGSTPKPVCMPDGSVISLLAVTRGSNGSVVLGTSWQRFLYKLLPAKQKKYSYAKPFFQPRSLDTNAVFWLQSVSASNRLALETRAQIFLVDEYGCEMPVSAQVVFRGTDREVCCVGFDKTDRLHGELAGVCIYDAFSTNDDGGQFWDPHTNRPAGWSPATMRGFRGMQRIWSVDEVEHIALYSKLRSGDRETRPSAVGNYFSQIIFSMPDAGHLTIGFELEVRDNKGKQIQIHAKSWGINGGGMLVNFLPDLDPKEGPFSITIRSDYSEHIFEKVSAVAWANHD